MENALRERLVRADMAKVIVERPRHGSRLRGAAKGGRKEAGKLGLENLPRREGIKRRHKGGSKMLNEHLGPLRRYLRAQVGRPWDQVFSEICQHINRNSAVQDHVRDHVWDYVTRHVFLVDGVPYDAAPRWGKPRPVADRRAGLYICPRTRLLMEAQPRRRPPVKRPVTQIPIDGDHWYALINGLWFAVTRHTTWNWDSWHERWVKSEWEAKRQVGKREIRREITPHVAPWQA